MSAPTVLTGELLALVVDTRSIIADAYTALHDANGRGVTADDLEAFSVAMTTVKATEAEIRSKWFSRAASVTVSGSSPSFLTLAAPGSSGESGDWINEIHLNRSGCRKLAVQWSAAIENLHGHVPCAVRGRTVSATRQERWMCLRVMATGRRYASILKALPPTWVDHD